MSNNIVKIDSRHVTASAVAFDDEARIYLTYNGHCTYVSLPLFLETTRYKKRGVDIDELISRLSELKLKLYMLNSPE